MNEEKKYGEEFSACPVIYALNLIGGKWHLPVIWLLNRDAVLRYNEIKRRICGITNMMLTQTLKDLEEKGLVHRVQYPEIPPRVEYSLTENGQRLLPALDELAKWGITQFEQHAANQDGKYRCSECEIITSE
ncbi:MAG TPA: helix-turn-helix domain-containing protein [Patescibacteria group bacterium]|nr:helix-turn-helix domain-containing protein [Patescibacteria group bacterium]